MINFADSENFKEFPFPDPDHHDIVYVICINTPGQEASIPIYVGLCTKHIGRLGDYVSANYTAPTDFKVGEAIKYLQRRGYQVIFKYKESINAKCEETTLLALFDLQHALLLNKFKNGYDYKNTAEKQAVLERLHHFVDDIITQWRSQ